MRYVNITQLYIDLYARMQFYQIVNLVISARYLSDCGKVCLPPQSSKALWGLVSVAWNTLNYFYAFFFFPGKCPR